MLKTLLVALVAGLAGSAIGAALMNALIQQQVAALLLSHEQQRARITAAETQAKQAEATAQKAERERTAYEETIEALETKVAQIESAQGTLSAAVPPVPPVPPAQEAPPREAPGKEAIRAETEAAEPADGPGGREAQVTNLREAIRRFYDTQLAQTSDPEQQERLLALAEYAEYGIDLRMQLEAVTDPQERAELALETRVTYANHDMYLRAEQNAQLIQTAQQLGISDPAQINQFVDAMQQTLRGPFFQQSTLTGGRNVPLPTP